NCFKNYLKMKKSVLFALAVLLTAAGFGQGKFFTKGGKINFDAEGELDDLEEIKAVSNTAACVYDAASGNMEWVVLMKSFKFKNALMQENFNENYMESQKYPKAVFKGQVVDFQKVKLTKDGEYPATVNGKLTLHGVTKDITAKGKFQVKSGAVTAASDLKIRLADYSIKVPSVVGNKIADEVKVFINATLEPLKK